MVAIIRVWSAQLLNYFIFPRGIQALIPSGRQVKHVPDRDLFPIGKSHGPDRKIQTINDSSPGNGSERSHPGFISDIRDVSHGGGIVTDVYPTTESTIQGCRRLRLCQRIKAPLRGMNSMFHSPSLPSFTPSGRGTPEVSYPVAPLWPPPSASHCCLAPAVPPLARPCFSSSSGLLSAASHPAAAAATPCRAFAVPARSRNCCVVVLFTTSHFAVPVNANFLLIVFFPLCLSFCPVIFVWSMRNRAEKSDRPVLHR